MSGFENVQIHPVPYPSQETHKPKEKLMTIHKQTEGIKKNRNIQKNKIENLINIECPTTVLSCSVTSVSL